MSAWDQLSFLVGHWSSPLSGQPGEEMSGSSTFEFQLDQKIMIRNSRAEFAPKPGEKVGVVHEDLLVIYQQIGEEQLRAIYFDNEGHVIHYELSFQDGHPGVIFESDAAFPGPHAKLVYDCAPDGTLGLEFFVAAPGGELLSHVKGRLVREA